MRNRIVNSFVKYSKIFLIYLNKDKKYALDVYDDILNKRNNETLVLCYEEINNYK